MNPDTGPYTPNQTDYAIQMLKEVFGNAFSHIVSGNATAAENTAANMLGTAFAFFNSGVLFFGAILLTWVTVFGITNSANDGQVLGKKWSTFYTPLRTFTASGLLIPSASGYAGVQLAILLIVSWSVGFASNMWGKVVYYAINDQAVEQALKSVQEDPSFDQLAYNALRMQVCAKAVNQGVNQTMGQGSVNLHMIPLDDSSSSINVKNPVSGWGVGAVTSMVATGPVGVGVGAAAALATSNPYSATTYTETIVMGDQKWPGSQDICGKMILSNTYIAPDTHSSTTQEVAKQVRDAVNTIRFKYAQGLLNPEGEIGVIAQRLAQVADSSGGQPISAKAINDKIVALRGRMMAEITQEVRTQVSSKNSAILDKFKENGWVMAGSLHRELAQIKDAIRSVTTTKYEYVPGSANVQHLFPAGSVADAIQLVMGRYDALVATVIQKSNPNNNSTSTTGKPTLPSLQTKFSASDFTDGGNSIKSQITAYFNRLPDAIISGVVYYLGEDGGDPVMQVKNIGDWMATLAETFMLTKANLTATVGGLTKFFETMSNQQVIGVPSAAAAGFAAFIGNLIEELSKIAWPGITTLLYGGYFLGIWIPMVPFYVFALGVIGWLVQTIEALAAGSLWMVMHLTPERDDSFIGSQQQGYLLLMSLFARPPLMVLGIVASMAVLNPAVRFVNGGFIAAFRIVQTDSVTGILSIAGFLAIYCVIIFGVFMLVFSLPQTLPDRILRWIGAGIGDLGEQGTMGRIESGASGQARMAATSNASRRQAVESAGRDSVRQSEQRGMAQQQLDATRGLTDAIKNMGGGGQHDRGNDPMR